MYRTIRGDRKILPNVLYMKKIAYSKFFYLQHQILSFLIFNYLFHVVE